MELTLTWLRRYWSYQTKYRWCFRYYWSDFDLDLFDEKELFALFRELEIEGADDYDFGDMDLEVEKEAIKHVVSKMVVFIKGANTTDFEDFQNIITDETNRKSIDIIASASDSVWLK